MEGLHIFWNDEKVDEKEYIKKIQDYCSRYNYLTDKERAEAFTFFGRCYSNTVWQNVVAIFSIKAIKYFMSEYNEQFRRTVMPAMRENYDTIRQILLFGPESVDWKEEPDWENRPTLTSTWRKRVYGEH